MQPSGYRQNHPERLDAAFAALADPTRRAILARLALGEASVLELAAPFAMSQPAISKHLKVLERARLISRSRDAQRRPCRLEPLALKEAADWVENYRRFWMESFDRLDEHLQQMQIKEKKYGEREIVITRIFDAPRALVFQAWTDPQHLSQWFGPTVFTNPVCEVDPRVGGAWRIVMRAPDGSEYPCGGVYLEFAEPERLVFTNNSADKEGNPVIDGLTTVLFADEGGKTKLTLRTRGTTMVPYAAAYLAGMEAGWSQSLEKLARQLAKG